MADFDSVIFKAAANITAAVAEEAELEMNKEGAKTAAEFFHVLYDELAAPVNCDCDGGYFEVYEDKAGEYRFRLKAKNGEILVASEGYKSKESCLNGIACVRKYAKLAEIKEL